MGKLKNLFAKDLQLDKLPAELRPLVEQLRQERTAYEALAQRAEQLGTAQQMARLEQRLADLDKLASQFGDVRQSAAALEEGQRGTQARLTETKTLADAVRTDVEGMRGILAEVLAAKPQLPGILELVKSAGALRAEASAMEERMRESAVTVAAVVVIAPPM